MFRKKVEKPKEMVVKFSLDCKKGDPLWVELFSNYKDKNGKMVQRLEGKCALSWIPQLLIELTQAVKELNLRLKK